MEHRKARTLFGLRINAGEVTFLEAFEDCRLSWFFCAEVGVVIKLYYVE